MLDAISFADSLHGWCSSVQGLLLATTDGGAHWTKRQPPSAMPITTVLSRTPRECWIAGYNGLIAQTTDAGASWSVKQVYNATIQRLRFDRNGVGWAACNRGIVLRSNSDLSGWNLFTRAETEALNSLHFPDDSTLVTVGSAGTILRLSKQLH